MTAIWKIWPNIPGIYPHWRGEAKNRFWDRLWTLSEHIYAMKHDINNRKETCQSTGTRDSPKCPRIWRTLVQKWLRTVGEFLPTPKFLHWETLPASPHGRYITDSRQTLDVVARVYSLEQQDDGWAQAGLCHASSFSKDCAFECSYKSSTRFQVVGLSLHKNLMRDSYTLLLAWG